MGCCSTAMDSSSEGNPFPPFSNYVLGLCCFSILEIDIIMSIDCLMWFFLG